MRATRHIRRAVATTVVACLCAPALAGCGGSLSEAEYEKQLVRIHDRRNQAVAGLAAVAEDDVKYYANAQRDIQQAADDLDRIVPPRGVTKAHDTYVESMYGLARVFAKLADCAREDKRNPGSALTCKREIQQSELDDVQNDFLEAYTILRHEGYKLAKPPDA